MNKFEEKIVVGQFFVYLWPFWKLLKYKRQRESVIFSESQFSRFHNNFRDFIINKKNMTHEKRGCFLLQSENNYWDAEKLMKRGGGYILRDFQKGHKYTKIDPQLYFFNFIHQ